MAKKPKMGRPAEFENRVTVKVLLERRELAAVRARAAVAGVSVSAFIRRLLCAAKPKH